APDAAPAASDDRHTPVHWIPSRLRSSPIGAHSSTVENPYANLSHSTRTLAGEPLSQPEKEPFIAYLLIVISAPRSHSAGAKVAPVPAQENAEGFMMKKYGLSKWLVVLMVAGCTARSGKGPIDDDFSDLGKADAFSRRIRQPVETIQSGQTRDANYANPPRY